MEERASPSSRHVTIEAHDVAREGVYDTLTRVRKTVRKEVLAVTDPPVVATESPSGPISAECRKGYAMDDGCRQEKSIPWGKVPGTPFRHHFLWVPYGCRVDPTPRPGHRRRRGGNPDSQECSA